MRAAPRTPFDGTDRLIVDGTNLLHRMGAAGGAPVPAAALIGRLRGAAPAAIVIDIVFDGMGHGIHGRVAQQMFVKYSGRRTADDVILDLASEGIMQAGGSPTAGARILVVTDDRGLRELLSIKGVRTVSAAWLLGRLEVPVVANSASGNRRPTIEASTPGRMSHGKPAGGPGAKDGDDGPARPAWKPGRGATSKTGTARKVARHKRHPMPGT